MIFAPLKNTAAQCKNCNNNNTRLIMCQIILCEYGIIPHTMLRDKANRTNDEQVKSKKQNVVTLDKETLTQTPPKPVLVQAVCML